MWHPEIYNDLVKIVFLWVSVKCPGKLLHRSEILLFRVYVFPHESRSNWRKTDKNKVWQNLTIKTVKGANVPLDKHTFGHLIQNSHANQSQMVLGKQTSLRPISVGMHVCVFRPWRPLRTELAHSQNNSPAVADRGLFICRSLHSF